LVVAVRTRVVTTLVTAADPSTAESNPTFCGSDNPTIADLMITGDGVGTIVWYDAATDGNSLTDTTTLVDATTYYATLTYSGGCESSNRVAFTPTVVGVDSASLLFTTLEACALDNPTVAELIALEDVSSFDVLWYDTAASGTALNVSDALVDGTTYYAETIDAATGCIRSERVAVTVDLSNCDPQAYNFFIPDGFSPNGDGRNDTFFVPNIEVIFPEFSMEIDINQPAWDGSNGSGTAPNGVYFYIINYNKPGSKPIQGRLYLNR